MKIIPLSLTIIVLAGCVGAPKKPSAAPAASTAAIQQNLITLSDKVGAASSNQEDVRKLSNEIMQELIDLNLNHPAK